jgi:hypothetical protein
MLNLFLFINLKMKLFDIQILDLQISQRFESRERSSRNKVDPIIKQNSTINNNLNIYKTNFTHFSLTTLAINPDQ